MAHHHLSPLCFVSQVVSTCDTQTQIFWTYIHVNIFTETQEEWYTNNFVVRSVLIRTYVSEPYTSTLYNYYFEVAIKYY